MQHNFRVDIQALRGLAVLVVVFFHAHTPRVAGGYLGVDIFFVISGYLITTQVARAIGGGQFSFIDFYSRRALRLFPAAYVVFIVCLALAPWLLNSVEWGDFLQQTIGAVLFVANLVLWQQTDYFSSAAEYKVLLHTWSLSIEEQYYLLLPATLVIFNKRFWLIGAIVVTVASFVLYTALVDVKTITAFFLLPTRAFELGIGSVLALYSLNRKIATPTWLAAIAVAVLLIIPIWPLPVGNYGVLNIVLVCLAAAVVISANAPWINVNPLAKVLAAFGTISYSLYLVHWPIFSFLNNANIAEYLSLPARLFGLVLSVALSIVLYHFVEQRFRISGKDTAIPKNKVIGLLIVSGLILATSFVTAKSLSQSEFSHRMRFNIGMSPDCQLFNFDEQAACRTADDPEILLWGDSFAMHIASGMAETKGSKMMQATFSACAGVEDIALVRPPREVVSWSRECVAYNDNVLDYLARADSIKIVVMASQWSYFFNPRSIYERGADVVLDAGGAEVVAPFIKKTVDRIRALGKQVVFVEPPPWGEFDFGRCHERNRTGKISFGAGTDCMLSRADADRVRTETDALVDLISADDFVPIFRMVDALCDEKECKTVIDDTILYRDHAHFSYEGSSKVATDFELIKNFYRLTETKAPAGPDAE